MQIAQVHNTSRTDLITKFFGSYSIYKDEGNRKKERKRKKKLFGDELSWRQFRMQSSFQQTTKTREGREGLKYVGGR